MGVILINLGKLKEAELSTETIELNPNFRCHSNLGNILKDLGKEAELSTQSN